MYQSFLAIPLFNFPNLRRMSETPNHHYFSKKYCNTPPICIAVRLQFVLQCVWCPYALRKGEYSQYSSHLYRNTPPICIAIRLPFVSQCFWENLGGCGHWDVPQCYFACLFLCVPPRFAIRPSPFCGLR